VEYDGLITENLYEPRLRYPNRNGVYPRIADHRQLFRRLRTTPVISNDLDLDTPDGQETFNRLVYSKYEGDVFSNVPTCPCGFWHGGDVNGESCPECGFMAVPPTEQPIQPLIWVRAPKGVAGFLNPTVYGILYNVLKKPSISVLDWLIDPKYRPPKLHSIELELLEELGVKRGITYFIKHFDDVIEKLAAARRRIVKPNGTKVTITLLSTQSYDELAQFIGLYRDRLFSDYLPFPSKVAFVVEKVGKRTFVDSDMAPAINALISISKADRQTSNLSTLDSRTARGVRDLHAFYNKVNRDKNFSKEGVIRKLMYGFEPHFCMRAVITSIHKPHSHENVYLPWGGSILMLKLHIANKLLFEDYTPNEIQTLIYDNILRKNPKLDMILDKLIEETPGGRGLPILLTRFPSLYHGSTQYFDALIDRNPANLSIQIPIGTVRASNADQHKGPPTWKQIGDIPLIAGTSR